MSDANMKCRSLTKRIIIRKKEGGHIHITHNMQIKIIIIIIIIIAIENKMK